MIHVLKHDRMGMQRLPGAVIGCEQEFLRKQPPSASRCEPIRLLMDVDGER